MGVAVVGHVLCRMSPLPRATVYGIVIPRERMTRTIERQADCRTCADCRRSRSNACCSAGIVVPSSVRSVSSTSWRPCLAGEHLRAHRLHDMFGQDAAHQTQFRAMRRVVPQRQARLVAASEERTPGGIAEPGRNDDGHRHRAALHPGARGIRGWRGDRHVLSSCAPARIPLRDRAVVLVDDGDWNARRLAASPPRRKRSTRKTRRSRSAPRSP